jgi:hypothetical protein
MYRLATPEEVNGLPLEASKIYHELSQDFLNEVAAVDLKSPISVYGLAQKAQRLCSCEASMPQNLTS